MVTDFTVVVVEGGVGAVQWNHLIFITVNIYQKVLPGTTVMLILSFAEPTKLDPMQ